MPASQLTFTTPEQLALADEVVESQVLRSILDVNQDYFSIPIEQAITINVAGYSIPSRSIGGTVREVQIARGQRYIDLERVAIEDVARAETGSPRFFYVRQDKVFLYPTPSATVDNLRLWVDIAPGSYVEPSASAVITAIDTVTGIVTVGTIPSDWATGDVFDFVSQGGSHSYIAIDQTSTLVSGSDITFASLPIDLAVGDYIMPQGQSSLVQAPSVYRPVIAQGTAALMLENSNQPSAEKASKFFIEQLRIAQGIIASRVTGELEDITPRNWRWGY